MGKERELLEASRTGKVAVVGQILDQISKRVGPLYSFRRGISINVQDSNGYTALHHASLNGHSNIVHLLLAHDAAIDIPDIRGTTPLYLAAWAGHQNIVKMLLMHGTKPANPNTQTIDNETPLHCAAQHGHNTVLAILLAYGGNPAIRNNSFQTPLDLAAQFGRLQSVQILLRTHPALLDPFRKCNANASKKKHIFTHSCLHLASRNGHKKIVETLLAAGVDVNILTHAGTALHEAALCGKKSVVSVLLKAGINPNATDGVGHTALDLLKEYPPHITYEIVSVINDYCAHLANGELKAISEHSLQSTELNTSNEEESESTVHKQLKEPVIRKKKTNNASIFATHPESYLKMKPINGSNASIDKDSTTGNVLTYKPIYKQSFASPGNSSCNLVQQNGKLNDQRFLFPFKPYEHIFLSRSDSEISSKSSPNPAHHNHCKDEYVKMTEPIYIRAPKATRKKPLPSPRNLRSINNANIDFSLSPDVQVPFCKRKIDSNNNRHSPTPDFPPPSVLEAENTIFECIKPSDRNKRKSIRFNHGEEELETLDRYFLQTMNIANSVESISSPVSDQVEEFVGDVPFAGLFKGSSLNLLESNNMPIENKADHLRSPSLVRSVKLMSAKTRQCSPHNETNTTEEFNETKIWNEIDSILENIGNEVSKADISQIKEHFRDLENSTGPEKQNAQINFKMRNPSELLLLGIPRKDAGVSNWCHSANTLIYGEIRYNVYYLGSTVIKVLQGTESTRKSIQKLKLHDSTTECNETLLQDCNSSTKYLKAKRSKRLEVTIAVSYIGVKFTDTVERDSICVHEVENINCVCQDAEDLRYFAYVTKEEDMHYCHVFMADNLDLVKEIILTLGQAFEVAYQLSLMKSETLPTEANDGSTNFV